MPAPPRSVNSKEKREDESSLKFCDYENLKKNHYRICIKILCLHFFFIEVRDRGAFLASFAKQPAPADQPTPSKRPDRHDFFLVVGFSDLFFKTPFRYGISHEPVFGTGYSHCCTVHTFSSSVQESASPSRPPLRVVAANPLQVQSRSPFAHIILVESKTQ